MLKITISILFLTALFISCRNELTSRSELGEYIKDKDNGIYHEYGHGDYRYTCYYYPSCMFITEDSVQGNQTGNQVGLLNFKLNLQYKNNELLAKYKSMPTMYSGVIQDLTFNMQDKIYAVNNRGDTIPIYSYNYTYGFGYTKANTILCQFNKDRVYKNKSFTLVFNWPELELPKGKFEFNTRKVKNTPKIKTNS